MLLALLAMLAVAVVASACRDGGSLTDPNGSRARFNEAYELDPIEVTACGPGTSGDYPNCVPDNQECDPTFDASCNPGGWDDPCTVDPSAPGCSEDPCAMYPESCYGGEYPSDPPPPNEADGICDSRVENCLKALENGEKAVLKRAIRNELNTRNATCVALGNQLNKMIDEGKMYRGTTGSDTHDAEYDPNTGNAHIDNEFWQAYREAVEAYPQTPGTQERAENARETLLALGLHEAAHALGYRHPESNGDTPYTSSPFDMMDTRSGGTECVKF